MEIVSIQLLGSPLDHLGAFEKGAMFRTMLTKKCIEPLAAPGGAIPGSYRFRTVAGNSNNYSYYIMVNGGYNYHYGYYIMWVKQCHNYGISGYILVMNNG